MINLAKRIVEAVMGKSDEIAEMGNLRLLHYKRFDGKWYLCEENEGEYCFLTYKWNIVTAVLETLDNLEPLGVLYNPIPTSLYHWAYGLLAITIEMVTNAYISNSTSFYRQANGLWIKCAENESEWVSLQTGEHEKVMHSGYPKETIYLELSRRNRVNEGKTPDMCESPQDFMLFYVEGLVERECSATKENWGPGMGSENLFRVVELNGHVYSMYFKDATDEEGNIYSQKWRRDDQYHRVTGPAYIRSVTPYIREEWYLAEYESTWYLDGIELVVDITSQFESIRRKADERRLKAWEINPDLIPF